MSPTLDVHQCSHQQPVMAHLARPLELGNQPGHDGQSLLHARGHDSACRSRLGAPAGRVYEGPLDWNSRRPGRGVDVLRAEAPRLVHLDADQVDVGVSGSPGHENLNDGVIRLPTAKTGPACRSSRRKSANGATGQDGDGLFLYLRQWTIVQNHDQPACVDLPPPCVKHAVDGRRRQPEIRQLIPSHDVCLQAGQAQEAFAHAADELQRDDWHPLTLSLAA